MQNNYKVEIKVLVSSTSKERLMQEFKDFLENEQDVYIEPDGSLEDYIKIYDV